MDCVDFTPFIDPIDNRLIIDGNEYRPARILRNNQIISSTNNNINNPLNNNNNLNESTQQQRKRKLPLPYVLELNDMFIMALKNNNNNQEEKVRQNNQKGVLLCVYIKVSGVAAKGQ